MAEEDATVCYDAANQYARLLQFHPKRVTNPFTLPQLCKCSVRRKGQLPEEGSVPSAAKPSYKYQALTLIKPQRHEDMPTFWGRNLDVVTQAIKAIRYPNMELRWEGGCRGTKEAANEREEED